MWAEGDIGGDDSQKIAGVWSCEEKKGGRSSINSTQLTSGRTSSTRKTKKFVDERDSGGYEQAGNQ